MWDVVCFLPCDFIRTYGGVVLYYSRVCTNTHTSLYVLRTYIYGELENGKYKLNMCGSNGVTTAASQHHQRNDDQPQEQPGAQSSTWGCCVAAPPVCCPAARWAAGKLREAADTSGFLERSPTIFSFFSFWCHSGLGRKYSTRIDSDVSINCTLYFDISWPRQGYSIIFYFRGLV